MALFKTNAELALYFPARMTLDMKDIAQTMDRVENDYLTEQVLGTAQYNELLTAYNADSIVPGDRLSLLLHRCRGVVSHLVALHYADLGALQLTSSGFVVATGNDGQAVAAANKVDRLKRELQSAGFSFLDRCLGFLQANIADYPLWGDSPFAKTAQGLLRSTSQFNLVCDIGNSHWFYWRLRPVIQRHQNADGLIALTLCSEALYDELVAQSNAGDSFTAANEKLMLIIRPAIAHLSIAEAVADRAVNKDDRGIWTFQSFTGAAGGGPMAASEERLNAFKEYHTTRAAEFVQALKNKLRQLAAAGQLPLYAASQCYTAYTTTPEAPPADPTRMVGGFI